MIGVGGQRDLTGSAAQGRLAAQAHCTTHAAVAADAEYPAERALVRIPASDGQMMLNEYFRESKFPNLKPSPLRYRAFQDPKIVRHRHNQDRLRCTRPRLRPMKGDRQGSLTGQAQYIACIRVQAGRNIHGNDPGPAPGSSVRLPPHNHPAEPGPGPCPAGRREASRRKRCSLPARAGSLRRPHASGRPRWPRLRPGNQLTSGHRQAHSGRPHEPVARLYSRLPRCYPRHRKSANCSNHDRPAWRIQKHCARLAPSTRYPVYRVPLWRFHPNA